MVGKSYEERVRRLKLWTGKREQTSFNWAVYKMFGG